MANLTFTKVDNHYEATHTITGDAKLHVEREREGLFAISQKSFDDNTISYVGVKESTTYVRNIDTDLVSSVYPKYLKFFSDAPVTKAMIG